MNFWDLWWIIPLIMIAMCIFMMVFMMRGCMRKMKHMMAGAGSSGPGAGMEMAHCPCMAMMGRFMKGNATQKRRAMTRQGDKNYTLNVTGTKTVCPVGETAGKQCIEAGRIPVISCEGACIRGEIARLAAHLVAKEDPFSRSCHGEMFTAPHSAMARWMEEAEYTVVIDGCFMKCHGRVLENLIGKDKVAQFDALSIYKKYSDLINIDDVPEAERKSTARQVADKVLEKLRSGSLKRESNAGAGCES